MMNSLFNIQDLTYFDYFVLIVIAISMLIAFLRGFVKSFLFFSSWIIAGALTLELYPYTYAFIGKQVNNELACKIIASFGIFIFLLIIVSIINNYLLDLTSGLRGGAVDMSLGMAFGLARGCIITCAVFWVVSTFTAAWNNAEEPSWLKSSQSYNLLKLGSDEFVELVSGGAIHDKTVKVMNQFYPDKAKSKSLETQKN
jgi:membrane protein required for colicin V production